MINSEKPIIGAHNALTAYKPRYPWGWLSIPFSRCQRHTLSYCLSNDCRCFDIRVSYDRKGQLRARHGHTVFNVDVANKLALLNANVTTANPIYIRLILEQQRHDFDRYVFWAFCESCKADYPNLTFFAGVRKTDWQLIYDFGTGITESDVVQYVGSMADDARWYEKICPWLYAKRKNADNKQLATEAGKIYLFDYL